LRVDFLWKFLAQKQNEKRDFDLFSSGFLKMNIFEVFKFLRERSVKNRELQKFFLI
jgi:hypothetical protein